MSKEIIVKPFDWNDNLAEIALEDFATIQQNLSYGIATTIGMALAKLEFLEKQGCKVEPPEQAEIEKAYELGKAEQQKAGRWIPVSELPEKAGRYVVVISGTSDDNIDTAYYAGGMWYKSKIKAWMPVPPYKEESEDKG